MGQMYYLRVTAHHSGGYGHPADSMPAKPMQSSDPPIEITLSTLGSDYTAEDIGSKLLVEWSHPEATGTDNNLVGDGGDAVTEYLIEWSKKDFSLDDACLSGQDTKKNCYHHSIQRVEVGCGNDRAFTPKGTFRLQFDTRPSTTSTCSWRRSATSSSHNVSFHP